MFLFQGLLLWIDIFSVAFRNKVLRLLSLEFRLHENLLFGRVKLTGYIAFAVNVVSSNPYIGLSPRTKISLFLLSIWTDELLSAPKVMAIIPILPSVNDDFERKSNPIP